MPCFPVATAGTSTPPPFPLQQPVHSDSSSCEHLSEQKANSDDQQVQAVYGLISRLLPDCCQATFSLSLAAKPAGSHGHFSVAVNDGTVNLSGTSGVQLACGVHWFLKYFCGCSVSWEATGGLQASSASPTPESLAAMEAKGTVTVERAVPLSFYQNVVTMSYSMAFWEWDRWEAELDWMALQGINMPLMPLGMEALQVATFSALGLSASQLQDFFPGPAFLAWGRMGNIQGYGGPLPAAYMAKQLELAQKVVQRMRELGMTPVYPAFAGFVPRALVQLYPEAAVTPASNWCHFPAGYCCPCLLDPTDPLFAKIGAAYIRTLRDTLGWDSASYYIADSFNEMKPASDSPEYLSGISASVFAGMTAADPNATWVMQAWLFFSDSRFWQPPQIKALLDGVPRGRLVLLDLFADEHPVWSRTASMYGHPFIWCMLHNFGGNLEIYGALPAVAEGVAAALAAAPENMVGVGMAPEGIEQNPAVYEFMAEMAFRGRAASAAAPGGLAAWFRDYAARRYAAAGPLPLPAAAAVEGAWQLLARSVYSCRDKLHNTVADIPTSRPGLSRSEIVGWGLAPHLWYNVGDVRAAWELLLQAAAAAPSLPSCSSAFVYDLLDVSRELMSKIAGRFWADAVEAYKAGNLAGLRSSGAALTGLLSDMDALLASHKAFLLGPVLQRARAYAAPISSGSGAADSGTGDYADGMPADDGPLHKSASTASTDSMRSLSSSSTVSPAESAVDAAADQAQQEQQQLAALYEWNMRTQLTIWGTSAIAGDSEVSDYANKEWSGLLSSFYLPRWRAWLARLEADLMLGRQYDAAAWRLEVLMMTYRWINHGSTAAASAGRSSGGASGQSEAVAAEAPASAGTPAVTGVDAEPELVLVPRGDPVQLSRKAYQHYALLLAPGCSATAETAAAAAAAAEASLASAIAPGVAAACTSSSTMVAAAAAAVVVGAAGAAAAAVAAANAGPAPMAVEAMAA